MGDPFPSEHALAERLGVNRSTVDGVIRHLEADGVVSRKGCKRLSVSMPELAQISPRTTDALILSQVTFGDLCEVSRELEPSAARLAAERRNDHQIAGMKANLEVMQPDVILGRLPGKTDLAFHGLVAAAGNPAFLMARESVGQPLYPAFEEFEAQFPQAGTRQLHAHAGIIAGLQRRYPAHAQMWMARDLDNLKRGWQLANLPMGKRITPTGMGLGGQYQSVRPAFRAL